MGLGLRTALLSFGLLVGVTACGGSVADADRPVPATASAAPLTPFCAAAQHNADALRPLNGFAQRGSVPPDQLGRTVDAVRNSGIELIAAAPSDIRADVQIVVDALDAQLDALERAKRRHRRRRARPGRLRDGRRHRRGGRLAARERLHHPHLPGVLAAYAGPSR